MRYLTSALSGALLILFATLPSAAQSPAIDFARSSLAIVSGDQRHNFSVEMAVTPEQRSRGLMFRRNLAPDAGMLFDYGPKPQRAMMWMRNTYIPLDMVFIDANGRIESIAERTVPFSLETISSRGPVLGVLELNGGTAARLGIAPGDLVEHPLFGTAN